MLYLGAASGTTVSHVADIVGPVSTIWKSENIIYAHIRAKLACTCEFGVEVMLE